MTEMILRALNQTGHNWTLGDITKEDDQTTYRFVSEDTFDFPSQDVERVYHAIPYLRNTSEFCRTRTNIRRADGKLTNIFTVRVAHVCK